MQDSMEDVREAALKIVWKLGLRNPEMWVPSLPSDTRYCHTPLTPLMHDSFDTSLQAAFLLSPNPFSSPFLFLPLLPPPPSTSMTDLKQDATVRLRLVDDAFIRICDMVNDISVHVRALATRLLVTWGEIMRMGIIWNVLGFFF